MIPNLLACAIALATALLAQTGQENPELAAFDDAIRAAMAKHQVPGMSIAIAVEGRLVHARGFGLVDRDRTERVQPDSVFRVASVSKLINGIAAMRLVDQGKLRLDDSAFGTVLNNVVPPGSATKLPAYNQITVRQLLQHTSGFPFLVDDLNSTVNQRAAATAHGVTFDQVTADNIISWQLGRPLPVEPGRAYNYSNGGTIAAARVIARASGKSYEQYIREDVLAPLGIEQTRLANPHRRDAFPGEVRYHMPVGTARVQSPFVGAGLEDRPYTIHTRAQDGSGGWTSTAIDLARLAGRLNPPRANSILSEQAFQEMIRRPPAPLPQTGNSWYAAGTEVLDQGGGNYRLMHSGSLAGTNAQVIRYHPRDVTIAWISNQRATGDDPDDLNIELRVAIESVFNAYVRSGRPWPAHDLFGNYYAGDRPRASAAGTLNAASLKGGGIAPGQVVTIFGERLGGDALTTAQVADGRLATELAGTRVLFDGVAAPLVFISAGQVSAIVPYGVSGRRTVRMEVERLGVRSEPATLPVVEASPALFTANSSGSGPAAAQVFPDARVAVLYATGEGLLNPQPADGELAVAQPLPAPRLPVKVLLAGREVPILYAGGVPGLTAGVIQINIQVPEDLAERQNMPLVLQIGETRSPDGVTFALR